MIGLLLIAHGDVAQSLLDSAKHILGNEPEQCQIVSVQNHNDCEALCSHIQACMARFDQCEGILILTEIYGATPSNQVMPFLAAGKVAAIAGINLPMLLRTITYRHLGLDQLVEKAISGGREGVMTFNPSY